MQYLDSEFYFHHTITENPDQSQFSFHSHLQYEVYCFLSGQGYYTVEGHDYPLVPGCVLLMRSGEVHMPHINASSPYERITLHFLPELMDKYDPDTLLAPFQNRPLGYGNILLPSEKLLNVENMLRRISSESPDPTEVRKRIIAYLPAILYEISCIVQNRDSIEKNTDKIPLVGRIIDYINQNTATIKGLQDITEKFQVSQTYLNRVFCQSTGSSVWEYVLLKRLMLARTEIRNGTLATIAARLAGYDTYSSFYRQYIKKFGISPEKDKFVRTK